MHNIEDRSDNDVQLCWIQEFNTLLRVTHSTHEATVCREKFEA